MTELNIVELIEKNPITKLSNNYNNKLLNKIKENFNEEQQKLFVSSFYCYLNYDKNKDFVVDLDNVWKWLGFNQKYNALRVLEKNFILDKDYINFAPQVRGAKNESNNNDEKIKKEDNRGGHNKQTFMMTINCFKKFCLKADTKKAMEIHEYYIKMEETLHEIIEEESNELRLQLENQNIELIKLDEKNKKQQEQLKNQKILEKEKVLLDEYATIGSIFYIIKVKTFDNGHYIVKIGESRKGIMNRYKEHKSKYEECLLLDCFKVEQSKDFETFIKEHELIRINRVNDLVGHEKELELFYIGKDLSYDILIEIINNNLKYFNSNNTDKLELEIEKLKLLLEMKNNNNNNLLLIDLINSVNNLTQKINKIESFQKEMNDKLNALQTKTTTNFNFQLPTIGPRLQKINPETMTIVKVYETVSECLKEYNYKIKRPSINKAIENNTIYQGYRWCFVERDLDKNIIHQIEPTKKTKIQNIDYVAKLNYDKTEILNVYLNRKIASIENNYKSSSALDNHVKNMTITQGHYYILYSKCPQNLIENFEKKHGEPFLYKDGLGQYTHENKLIKEYICKYYCCQELKISDRTLNKAIDNNMLYNNYYFRKIGSKLKVF